MECVHLVKCIKLDTCKCDYVLEFVKSSLVELSCTITPSFHLKDIYNAINGKGII